MKKPLRLLTSLLGLVLCGTSVQAANKYWDINGTTAGAGGATPSGNISGTAYWNSVADGTGTTAVWSGTTNTAVFAAGTDATGTYTVTLNSGITAAGIIVEEGTVKLAASSAITIGTGSVTINSGATLSVDSSLRIAASPGATCNINGGTLANTTTGANGSLIDGDFKIVLGSAGGTINFNASVLNIFDGVISGTGGLTKTGAGILALSAACTYSGSTTINGGTLRVRTSSDRLPTSTDVNVASGAALDPGSTSGNSQTIRSINGAGNVTYSASSTLVVNGSSSYNSTLSGVIGDGTGSVRGKLTKSGTGTLTLSGVNTFRGTFTLTAGTCTVTSTGKLCDPICDVVVNGGTLNLNNAAQTIENLIGTGGTINLATGHTLTVAPAGSGTYSGTLAGSGALTYNGATWTEILSGNNTYSGATTVNGGKLVGLTGAGCANSVMTVATGATNGVQVTDNTKQWTCAGLVYKSGSALDFDFGYTVAPSTTVAPLKVNGDVDMSAGAPTVTLKAYALPTGPGNYPLLTWTGSLLGTFPTTPVVLAPQTSGTLSVSGNTLYLNVTANTEPLTWATGSGTWDINVTPNWVDAANTVTNYLETTVPGDVVVFEDTKSGASPITVEVNGTVMPASVTVNASKDYTFTGGSIDGGAPITKQGSGKLTLHNANTTTGTTTVSGGTLQLGDGTSVNGSVAGPIANNASLVFANPSAQTYAGVISGTGTLTKQAAGTLTLSGANTFSGGATVNAGTLLLSSTANNMSGPVSVSGATLEISSGPCIGSTAAGSGNITLDNATFQNDATSVGADFLTPNRTITLGSGGGTLNLNGSGSILYTHDAGLIKGPGILTKDGPGELRTYNAHNTFSKLLVKAGMFTGGHGTASAYPDSFGAVPASTTADAITLQNGAQLRLAGGANVVLDSKQGITLNAAGTLRAVPSLTFSVPGLITGTGPLTVNSSVDTGTIVLGGANTFSGGLTLAGGRLDINNATALGSSAGMFTINASTIANTSGGAVAVANYPQTWNGSFTFAGTNDLNLGTGAVTLGASPVITVSANTLTVGGAISGSGYGLSKAGAGTLTLSGANSFDSFFTNSAGTLNINSATALGSGPFTIAGGILDNTSAGAITLANNNAQYWLANVTFTGTKDLNLGTGSVSINASRTVTVNNGKLTVGGPISELNTGYGLTKAGPGTLALGGSSSYSGVTTVSAGTLELDTLWALPSASQLVVSSNAVLDLNGYDVNVATLSGPGRIIHSGTIYLSGNSRTDTTYANYSCIYGVLTNGSIVKNGNHTMALRSTNTFTLPIDFQAGTLAVGVITNELPATTALSVPYYGTFELDANSQTLASLDGGGYVSLGGGTLTVNASVNSFYGVIQNSALSGSPTGLGHGLRGYYYDNMDFTSLLAVRDDANINFTDLTSAAQLPAAIYPNTNTISVRWLGQVLAPASGLYQFTTTTDDGVRLWVNGALVIDSFVAQGAPNDVKSGTISLVANTRYDIMMEYANGTGAARALLSWMPPGDSTTNVIPTDYLFLPGPGKLVKTGTGTLTLTGQNTYSGETVISAGTLDVQGALGAGDVSVASGATLTISAPQAVSGDLLLSGAAPVVNLNLYGGMAYVHGLSFDGGVTYQPAGIYGPIGSGANYENTRFQGVGSVYVGAGPVASHSLTSSQPTASYGTALTLTSTVTGPGATGTVTFYDGASALGTATLDDSGVATLTVDKLPVAGSPHALKAVYSGDNNYTPSTSSVLSQTITPATLVPSVTAANKVYDGTTAATLSGLSLAGVLSSDTPYVHLAAGATNFVDRNVGTGKAVNATGLTLTGSQAASYVLFATSASATANITARPLTVTAVANTKPYDGTTSSAGAPIITVGALATGDTAVWHQTFDSASVGARVLTPSGTVTDGNGGANYTVTFATATGSITAQCSATNALVGITPNVDGTYTLSFQGTAQAQYYVQTTTNVAPPITWVPLVGSTNTVSNANGTWSVIVTNNLAKAFYRSVAINVCP